MSVGFKRVLKMLLERIDQAIDAKCKIIASEVVDEYIEQQEAARLEKEEQRKKKDVKSRVAEMVSLERERRWRTGEENPSNSPK